MFAACQMVVREEGIQVFAVSERKVCSCLQSVKWLLEGGMHVFAVSQMAVKRRYACVCSQSVGC